MVLDKLNLFELTHDSESKIPSFAYCAITALNQLIKVGDSIDYEKILRILDCLDPALLSSEPHQYIDSTGKTRETASQKEIYFKIKSDACNSIR